MNERDRPEEPQTLSDDDARRLLARASEIDSAQSAELPLAELRQASLEAGIAPDAFEQALVELRGSHSVTNSESETTAPTIRRKWRGALLNTAKTVGIVLATLFVLMMLVDLIG